MTPTAWHPFDETAAASTLATFIEWLRASGRLADADPASVDTWRRADPAGFGAAIAAFAGLDPDRSPAANLLRFTGAREALVLHHAGQRRVWSRDALHSGTPPLPACIADRLRALSWPALLDLAAGHLLDANTRPDDRLLWTGGAADPWPFGALIVGATVILAGDSPLDPRALAAAERAMLLRPRSSDPDAG
ncbi:hypothetical protein [Limobrevibacterium gyesilva]|uniref:Uncharacterized protein n=1 Tax=Limobrevibacterium gyesilva TaxID=2991712 RepID=A0AA41YHR5_9PROT|nr:hypothetical protein [Limobrevibacterium gyesilva]MCW3473631.1 hypothetical protein [Limobrevibacterium gyesilva]